MCPTRPTLKTCLLIAAMLFLFDHSPTPAVASADKALPTPPPPNPANPVNYIEWLNQTFGQGISPEAYNLYQKAAQQYVDYNGDASTLLDDPTSEKATQWLQSNKQAIETFKKAAQLKYCYFPVVGNSEYENERWKGALIGALLPNYGPHRNLTKLLLLEGLRASKSGSPDSLADKGLLVMRAGHHAATAPMPIARLVGIVEINSGYLAIRKSLANTNTPAKLADTILPELNQVDPPLPPMDRNTFTERYAALDIAQRIFGPKKSGDQWALNQGGFAFVAEAYRNKEAIESPDAGKILKEQGYEKTIKELNYLYDLQDSVISSDFMELEKNVQKLDRRLEKQKTPLVFLVADIQRARISDIRFQASRNATHLVVRILAHKHKTGQLPDSLDDLDLKDNESLRIDPLTEKDLIYRKTGDTFTLYTTADNMKDDNGTHNDSWTEGDYVFWPVQDND